MDESYKIDFILLKKHFLAKACLFSFPNLVEAQDNYNFLENFILPPHQKNYSQNYHNELLPIHKDIIYQINIFFDESCTSDNFILHVQKFAIFFSIVWGIKKLKKFKTSDEYEYVIKKLKISDKETKLFEQLFSFTKDEFNLLDLFVCLNTQLQNIQKFFYTFDIIDYQKNIEKITFIEISFIIVRNFIDKKNYFDNIHETDIDKPQWDYSLSTSHLIDENEITDDDILNEEKNSNVCYLNRFVFLNSLTEQFQNWIIFNMNLTNIYKLKNVPNFDILDRKTYFSFLIKTIRFAISNKYVIKKIIKNQNGLNIFYSLTFISIHSLKINYKIFLSLPIFFKVNSILYSCNVIYTNVLESYQKHHSVVAPWAPINDDFIKNVNKTPCYIFQKFWRLTLEKILNEKKWKEEHFQKCDFFDSLNNELKILRLKYKTWQKKIIAKNYVQLSQDSIEKFLNLKKNIDQTMSIDENNIDTINKNEKKKVIVKRKNALFRKNTIESENDLEHCEKWTYLKLIEKLLKEDEDKNKNKKETKIELLLKIRKKQTDLNHFLIFQNFYNIKYIPFVNEPNTPFYFSTFCDFRGRNYNNSPMGVYNHPIFRNLYYYGYYTSEEVSLLLDKTSYDFKTESRSANIYNKYCDLDEVKNFIKLYEILPKFTNILIPIFLNSAQIYKTKILNDRDRIETIELIKKGIDLFLEPNLREDFTLEQQLLYEKNKEIINDLIQNSKNDNNKIKKIPLWLDSNASVIQIGANIFYCKNAEVFELFNLATSEVLFDIYQVLFKIFQAKNLLPKGKTNILPRKFKKWLTMTIKYGIGEKRVIKVFMQKINEILAEKNETKLTEEEKRLLKIDIKCIYKLIKYEYETDFFFEISSQNFLSSMMEVFFGKKKGISSFLCSSEEINTRFNITLFDNSVITLVYFKNKLNRLDIGKGKNRESVTNYSNCVIKDANDNTKIFYNIDVMQTKIAFLANIIHAHDALFLRNILSKLQNPILSIHDSFGIDALNISRLIDCANDSFFISCVKEELKIKKQQYKPKNSLYSIHILS